MAPNTADETRTETRTGTSGPHTARARNSAVKVTPSAWILCDASEISAVRVSMGLKRTPDCTALLGEAPRADSVRADRLFPAVGAVPLEGLTSDGGDAVEIPVTVEEGQSLELRGRCNHQVHRACAAVLPFAGQQFLDPPGAIISSVVHGHPAEEQAHVLDASGPVLGRTRAVEELQLG